MQVEVAASMMKKTRDLTVSVLLDGQDKHAWRILTTVRYTSANMEPHVKMELINTGTNMMLSIQAFIKQFKPCEDIFPFNKNYKGSCYCSNIFLRF